MSTLRLARRSAALIGAAAGLGLLLVTAAGADPINLNLPANMTVEAKNASGAAVSFRATATNQKGKPLQVVCTPSSGSVFPLGKTTVTCTVNDYDQDSAQGTFGVTVRDTTAPTLSAHPDVTAEATGPAGANVSYTNPTATDAVDPAPTVSCAPASGAQFPLGSTTVHCTATDAAGNVGESSFAILVGDSAAPTLSAHADVMAEATSPAGANVSYTSPTAVDSFGAPLPVVCTPSSGTQFRLGRTVVECSAQDSNGNIGRVTFLVRVRDTTPPVLKVPAAIVVPEGDTTGAVASFLASVKATDLVDPNPRIVNDAPPSFSRGTSVVTFVATDSFGNSAVASSSVTVVASALAPQGPTAVTAAPDIQPPGDVTGVGAKSGNGVVRLSWRPPFDADYDHVVVMRSSTIGGEVLAYSGKGTAFEDRPVMNGLRYRYVIVSYDTAGNRSAGVSLAALPRALALLAPRAGTVLRAGSAPLLAWKKVRRARYYNAQVYRGPLKILTVWPLQPRFRLHAKWRYGGRLQTLTPGVYRWYVWPGFGPRSLRHYGALLGQSAFVVRARAGG